MADQDRSKSKGKEFDSQTLNAANLTGRDASFKKKFDMLVAHIEKCAEDFYKMGLSEENSLEIARGAIVGQYAQIVQKEHENKQESLRKQYAFVEAEALLKGVTLEMVFQEDEEGQRARKIVDDLGADMIHREIKSYRREKRRCAEQEEKE